MCGVGRHSAGDDDEDGEDVVWVPVPASQVTGEIPRIQLTGEIPVVLTGEIPRVVADDADTSVVSAAPTAEEPEASTEAPKHVMVVVDPHTSTTRADVNLLRAMPGLRMRALAGLIVPFLIYTLLFVLLGRMDVYLIWLWIPTVVAGVVVGHFLDLAHKRARQKPVTTVTEASK
jgi:hypothetical protein